MSQTNARNEREAKLAEHSTAANKHDLRKAEHNMWGKRGEGRSHTKPARTVIDEGSIERHAFLLQVAYQTSIAASMKHVADVADP